MNEILTSAFITLVLLAGLAALVFWARRDTFAGIGPGLRTATDPDGVVAHPSAGDHLVLMRATADHAPAPYPS